MIYDKIQYRYFPIFLLILNGFSSDRRTGNDASERGDSPASLSRRHTTTLTRT